MWHRRWWSRASRCKWRWIVGKPPAGTPPVRPIGDLSAGVAAAGGSEDDQQQLGHEELKPRLPQRVYEPSLEMREAHEATGHAQYRSWCEWCVSGKGQANPHFAAEAPEEAEICFDYGYEDNDEKSAASIYGRETRYGSYCGTMVPSKGL